MNRRPPSRTQSRSSATSNGYKRQEGAPAAEVAEEAPAVEVAEEAPAAEVAVEALSPIHISEPTRQAEISNAVFCLKKKKAFEGSPSCSERSSLYLVVVLFTMITIDLPTSLVAN